jgi:predicted metalloprotease with PDZ domain
LIVGYQEEDLESGLSSGFFHLLIHEVAHCWVGGMLPPPEGETLVWFHEGFNEYLCMWHAAAAGLRGPDWFAEELAQHETAARRSSLGRVAFADPGVRWRDDDGPNETMGYKGGALLAFLADVELRRQGRPGLPLMVADLLRAGEPLSLAAIRAWMEENGLRDFHAARVARPDPLSGVGEALLALGYEPSESEAALTYLGLRTDVDGPPCEVLEVDPEGPAARAGFRPGDRIQGWFPARVAPPLVRPSVATPYRFGLAVIASGAETAEIDVLRGGEELKLSVEPRLIAGGYRRSYRRGGPAVDAFFRYEPPERR